MTRGPLSLMLVLVLGVVLAFAVLGVRDTLTSGTSVPLRVAAGVVRLAVLVFATIGLLDTVRGSALSGVRTLGSTGRMVPVSHPTFRATMELLTGTPLAPGNRVEVLTSGDDTYPRLWADLRAAQQSIVLQLYYCEPGRMADELRDILVERAAAGIHVFVLLDAFGAEAMPRSWRDALTGAGAQVALYRPIHWYSLNRANNRSHVRVVAIDGVIGYTGGFGIADKWYGDGRSPGQWRETNVRFTGPAVAQLLAAFTVGWAEATGDLLTADATLVASPLPAGVPEADGGKVAGLLHTPPTLGSTRAERFLSLSITAARERLFISNAYFVPDAPFRRALKEAVGRGVDVRVLTAGPATDSRTMLHAGRAQYTDLLAAGVRIYEYAPTMMHAKTLVVDGLWSSIGSMNFDNRSMVLNDEANLVALDPGLGRRLETLFVADIARSEEILLNAFRKRPWWHRVREWGANLVSRVL